MDTDPNDLLETNIYIPKPDLNPNVSLDSNEEFRKYYEKEIQKQAESKIVASIKKIELNEAEDDNNIINTNSFKANDNSNQQSNDKSRFIRETKTFVSIDSRDRIKTLYPKPNNFNIFLGRTFTNVKKIEMVSLEFPNTDAVINSGNNRIYWRNYEDIEQNNTVTTNGVIDYPIYSVELRTGSYTSATLQNEIQNKLNAVKRKNNTFHYFVPTLDMDTDVVTLTSLNLKQLSNNAFTTSLSSGVISVYLPEHGFSTNDFIYFVGVKSIAGITASVLNGFHKITVTGANNFTFEVNVKAAEAVTAGGNVAKAGAKLPFQLLWGENSGTVAQNIGFALENSSELIQTNVQSLQNIIQMDIILPYDHNATNGSGFQFTYEYIGQLISLGKLNGNTFEDYQNRTYTITNLFGTAGVRVQVTNESIITDLINNPLATHLKFGNKIIPVLSYSMYVVPSFLVTTFTSHNYTLIDIDSTITLSNTVDPTIDNDTSYDGDYLLQAVPSLNTIILPGVIGPPRTRNTNIYGTFSRQTPLQTWVISITNVESVTVNESGSNVLRTKITTLLPHKLVAGDKILIKNLKSTPLLNSEVTISSVPSSNTLLLSTVLSNIDIKNSINPYVSTGLITVSFPSHGFNSLVNIQNGTPYNFPITGETIRPIVVTTLNRHKLSVGNLVRLTGTSPQKINNILVSGVDPSLDGGGYIVKSVDSDYTFTIIKSSGTTSFPVITPSPNITGILGLNNDFYLYDVQDIGGISKTMLNGILFTVRDILDENTFTFMAPNTYATSTETGGGSSIYISSLRHGFNGIQKNTKNGVLTRSINLQGEDYVFLTCPQLDTMLNTGNIKHIFSRISLDQPPGYVCFKYLSNPKHFNTMPLDKLSELDFSIVYYNGSLYDFNDLDFSFTLQITEVSDGTNAFNVSSKRGITDTS